jgi:hypothetical protein
MRSVRLSPSALLLSIVVLFSATASGASCAEPWVEYPYVSDGFAISGPSAPVLTKQTAQTDVGPVETRILTWDFNETAVVLAIADYPSVNGNTVQQILSNSADGEAKSWKNGRVVSKTPLVLQGVTGIEAVIEADDFHGRSRIFVQGRRLWQILSLSSAGQPLYADTDRIFASFRFLQAQ